MAKDPAFLFYPGDYLRDTQCMSANVQVSYDRIMCEHMRNICITQQQLNFFTKRLSDDEKKEILFILKKIDGGYQIEWVAESICKRKDYSKSRAENRKGKSKNISSSYDPHMENANENEDVNKDVFVKGIKPDENFLLDLPEMKINSCIEYLKLTKNNDATRETVLAIWGIFKSTHFTGKKYYKSVEEIYSHFLQTLKFEKINGHSKTTTGGKHKGAMQLVSSLKQDFAARRKEDS
jgi:hypothetical protein